MNIILITNHSPLLHFPMGVQVHSCPFSSRHCIGSAFTSPYQYYYHHHHHPPHHSASSHPQSVPSSKSALSALPSSPPSPSAAPQYPPYSSPHRTQSTPPVVPDCPSQAPCTASRPPTPAALPCRRLPRRSGGVGSVACTSAAGCLLLKRWSRGRGRRGGGVVGWGNSRWGVRVPRERIGALAWWRSCGLCR
jgi:hypothetical protein